MVDFFVRNCIPTPAVLGRWADSPSSVVKDLRENRLVPPGTAWPTFLKFCHLTQGRMDSVRRLRDPAWLLSTQRQLEEYVHQMWSSHPSDSDRIFALTGNQLTGGLAPGAMVQAGLIVPA